MQAVNPYLGKNFPIWRDAQALMILIEQAVNGFSRYHRYTFGSELRLGAQCANNAIRLPSLRATRGNLIALRPSSNRIIRMARLPRRRRLAKTVFFGRIALIQALCLSQFLH